MALTDIEKVRHQIGDFEEPYVFTDTQIQNYLTSNDNSIPDTVEELRDIMMAYIASQPTEFRLGDFYEDNSDKFEAYIKAVDRAEKTKGKNAIPVIGGTSNPSPFSIGMFDE